MHKRLKCFRSLFWMFSNSQDRLCVSDLDSVVWNQSLWNTRVLPVGPSRLSAQTLAMRNSRTADRFMVAFSPAGEEIQSVSVVNILLLRHWVSSRDAQHRPQICPLTSRQTIKPPYNSRDEPSEQRKGYGASLWLFTKKKKKKNIS